MKKISHEVGIIILISFILTGLSVGLHPKRPDWYEVVDPEVVRWSIDEQRAEELDSQTVLWVDARKQKLFAKQHFPGAINLDLDNWEELLFGQLEQINQALGHPVIVYCDGTRCQKSKEVAKRLRELVGLEPVYLFAPHPTQGPQAALN